MTVCTRKARHVATFFGKKKYMQFGVEATLWKFGKYQVRTSTWTEPNPDISRLISRLPGNVP